MLIEANVDALVGPTHHYGGLGVGNVASIEHGRQASYPKQAALEGLAKAVLVSRLGVPQFVWLPPRRPRLELLEQLGIRGSLSEQLQAALRTAPHILSAVYSSSFMWAANSCTITPGCDADDGCMHVTPANLISSWHRGFEAAERSDDLQKMLCNVDGLRIHNPLPSLVPLRDEGAANHMRLCDSSGTLGFNVFVYGDGPQHDSTTFLPRQTRAACESIARLHGLNPETTYFLQQHPDAISAGVFHNDVIATSHRGWLLFHERAYLDADHELERLERLYQQQTGAPLIVRRITEQELPLQDAVRSYFFNSQILNATTPSGDASTVLVCPRQCQEIANARQLIDHLLADSNNTLHQVHFVPLNESMSGGGGPACLRLRISLTASQLADIPAMYRLDATSVDRLARAIDRWYPERLEFEQLADAGFAQAAQTIDQELHTALAVSPLAPRK